MHKDESSEFYIGYQPQGPAGIMRYVRLRLILLAATVISVALLLVYGQRRFAESFFDFGNLLDFEGYVIERPVPLLVVEKTGAPGSLPVRRDYVLVAEGKHGAESIINGFNGKKVRLRGTLIRRDGIEMIEIAGGSVQAIGSKSRSLSKEGGAVGKYTLTGEIVDSKCYLGVMNPGQSKPHRECASLCIRGGIPPLFVVRDAAGRTLHLWLLSADGLPVNMDVLDFVAEPVKISGAVEKIDGKLYFLIDPVSISRLKMYLQ